MEGRFASLVHASVTVASLLVTALLLAMSFGWRRFNRFSDASWFGALISMVILAIGYDRTTTPSAEPVPA